MFCPACGGEVDGHSERCLHCQQLLPLDFLLGRETDPIIRLTLEGRYRVEQFLSRGGMGYVYRGTDLAFSRPVAIKFLDDRFRSDREVVSRFHREALSAAGLDHPNIIPMYSVGESEGHHYFVMKYVEGRTVSQIVAERGRLSLPDAVRVAVQICDGLEHIHERGYVHRDIKPTNVMVDGRGHAFILDFGILRLTASNLTQTGLVAGTPEYMSPEQARDAKSTDARSDIYSMGVMLFEMLAGVRPFRADSAIDLLMKHLNDPPPRLADVGMSLPPAADAIIQRALAKDPRDRFASAREMREALVELVSTTTGESGLTALPAASAPESAEKPASFAGISQLGRGESPSDPKWAKEATPRSDVRATAIHGEASALYPPRRRRWPIALVTILVLGGGGAAIAVWLQQAKPPATVEPEPPPAPPPAERIAASAIPTAPEPAPIREAPPAPKPPSPDLPPAVKSPEPLPPKPTPAPAAPAPGQLRVESKPKGEVFLDGESLGMAPVTRERVPPGKHEIVVRKAGYVVYRTELQLAPGAAQVVKARLRAKTARLRVVSRDGKGLTWAEVSVDGKPFGSNPVNEREVPPGRHRILVRRTGFKPQERVVKVAPGALQVIEFVLKRE